MEKKINTQVKNKMNDENKNGEKIQSKNTNLKEKNIKASSKTLTRKNNNQSNNKKEIKNNAEKSDITKKKKQSVKKTENKIEVKKTSTKTEKISKKNTKKLPETKLNNIENEILTENINKTKENNDEQLTEIKHNIESKKIQTVEEINNFSKNSKCSFQLKEVIGLVIITAVVSLFIYNFIKPKRDDISLGSYEKELLSNYRDILTNYYKDVDARDLVKFATKGMISYLNDPYASYIDSDSVDDFNIDIYGEYEGIGIQISYNDEYEPIVVYVYPNSPAAKGGLEEGDILLYIDDVGIVGKDLESIKNLINSYGDKDFKLVFQRDGEGYEAVLNKDKIIIESVATKIYERNEQTIGYLSLNNFSKNSDEQFTEKLQELEKQNIDSLIIDLRYNSGGELESVHNIVSLFIPKGETIYQFKEKDKVTKYYSDNVETRDYKIVILANGGSASASELMIGALKEVYGATIVGTKTFGKGTGQQVVTLENGEKYKFTTKEWLTAKGNSINEVGIEPTIEIEQSAEYNDNPIEENDAQLNAALDFLTK